jgi:hypothetical protein
MAAVGANAVIPIAVAKATATMMRLLGPLRSMSSPKMLHSRR